ncbi:hypothetical protein ZWY2020_016223 [Hordeum vulgare]|nr:hypothetical protein ZWY2020_016223 [Hordeum vulgare]
MLLRRFPLEISSTGLGFDPTTGQDKLVRLFRNIVGQQKCEMCSPTASGEWRWWRCAGGNAPPRFACYVDGRPPVALDGSLYWLLHRRSSSDGDPQHDDPSCRSSSASSGSGWCARPRPPRFRLLPLRGRP